MRRREFLTLTSGATAAFSFGVSAQQRSMPVIGVLSGGSLDGEEDILTAFKRGLSQAGYAEDRDIAIEYRWANDRFERLPSLAADLVRRGVTVIVSLSGTIAVLAAKAATQTIPIVFVNGGDPVKAGLVASLNRPGGNITGINLIAGALNDKRLELLHEAAPKAVTIAILYNPNNPNHDPEVRLLTAAARKLGLQLQPIEATDVRDIDAAFATMTDKRADGLLVFTDPLLNDRFKQIVPLSARLGSPAIYGYREFAVAGGLMSYGTNRNDAYRQAALQVARILQGEKPAELPVQRSTKIELVINLNTAKTLGLTFPLSLLGRADEVIE
jgi:putative ABC transport system substrate-binding protein